MYKQLEERGHDISVIKASINDTVRKTVIAMEPYLIQSFHQRMNADSAEHTRNFQILGVDILLDKKLRAWMMEVNSNPSLNMFLEKELVPGQETSEEEKQLSELDKFVKSKVVTEAIRIVTGHGSNEFEGIFEQVRGPEDLGNMTIWNKA